MARSTLHNQIIAGMAVGGLVGLALNAGHAQGVVGADVVTGVAAVGEWLGRVFLALLNMIVVPLIFTSLVASVLAAGSRGGLGRLGGVTLAYYLLTSLLAIMTGLVLVNLIRPGEGLDYDTLVAAAGADPSAVAPTVPETGGPWAIVVDLVFRMIPSNVIAAASSNTTILSVIFFAMVFAIAAVHTPGGASQRLHDFFRDIYDVVLTLTGGVLRVAPLGIGGYLLAVTATTGLDVVSGLIWYMLTVAVALAVHAGVTLPLLLWLLTGRNPFAYARAMSEALLTAFSTASSSGTLPLTLRCVQERGEVPERVATFTLPLGATVNMDGTALYEAVAVLFVAQTLGGLTVGEQVVVAFTALLASIGAAGIPHAGTVMMVVVMQAVGLPTEGILVILAVDRVLDMCRTTVNVWSDAIGAAVVARLDAHLRG